MDSGLVRGLVARRARERGEGVRLPDAPLRLVLVYPSPYYTAMSSLGFLQVHRLLNLRPLSRAERATLPEPNLLPLHNRTRTPLLTLESQRPVGEAHVIGFSLAYELELAGLVTCLDLSGVPPLARDRTASDPFVILGGPITFSNPLPASPFADVVLLGEAEDTLPWLVSRLEQDTDAARGSNEKRRALLEELAELPGYYVPSIHGERMPALARASDHQLPAFSALRTPDTELHDMLLIEPERGCHRGCTFCVMRRSTNGGMRLFSPEDVLARVPEDVPRVGLVGAAVSDHPELRGILRALIDQRGLEVGVSSLRADRVDDELVGLLVRGGYRSITVALDAASERLRTAIEKNLRSRQVERVAWLARKHSLRHLKIYAIVGLPDETEGDLDELIQFALSLSKILPIKLGVSPFVPKLRTPLAMAEFLGEARVEARLAYLRRGLGGRVEIRGPGAREAYVEYRIAQGGHAHAAAAIAASRAGGSLAAWKRALKDVPERVQPPNLAELVPLSSAQKKGRQSLGSSPEGVGTNQRSNA